MIEFLARHEVGSLAKALQVFIVSSHVQQVNLGGII